MVASWMDMATDDTDAAAAATTSATKLAGAAA
jgi:hypothetical protein